MANRLVIVESPAKARTIAGFLGRDFVVESSIGHIRDLPVSSSDVEGPYKKWEVLGVDVENDFKPLYLVNQDKKSHVSGLKKLLKEADELYLATDEDREGEAIAWHLLEVLNPPARIPVKRMVFHEITPAAIQHAIDNPREIDRRLVDAQEARRGGAVVQTAREDACLFPLPRVRRDLPRRPPRHLAAKVPVLLGLKRVGGLHRGHFVAQDVVCPRVWVAEN